MADERSERANLDAGHAAAAEAALARARALLAMPGPLDERTREELLEAIEELRKALAPAIAARPGEARAVTTFAEAVAHEATREEPSGSIVRAALDGLGAAVERLEQRHPALTGIARRINDALAQMGI
jgi:hypothetical protein